MGIKKHYDAFVGKFMSGEDEDLKLPDIENSESESVA